MSFKVGDKVLVKGGTKEVKTVHGVHNDDQGNIYQLFHKKSAGNFIWRDYELELVKDDIPEFFDKATALKLAIDGYEITNRNFPAYKVTFDGKDFMVGFQDSIGERANGVLEHEDGWCLYKEHTPEPKFSKGDFVSTTSGKLGLIVDKPQYYNNKFLYNVRFNFLSKSNAISRTTPELQLREVDKELLKEASEEYSLSI